MLKIDFTVRGSLYLDIGKTKFISTLKGAV